MSPTKDVEILAPRTRECDLFRNRVFVHDQVNMSSLGWAFVLFGCILIKRGNLDTRDGHVHGMKMGGRPL